jgi:DnaJ-class molecular chaperone
MSVKCKLCRGSGENRTGIDMRVNNDICPRCGGYGTVPDKSGNSRTLTTQDQIYIDCNGRANLETERWQRDQRLATLIQKN